MYGPCSPCGKRSRLQTEVASRHEGCMLLRRLQQRLLAAVKAATKVSRCCEGCHIGYRLLRRLPHRLQAATKASITVGTDAMMAATEVLASWEWHEHSYQVAAEVPYVRKVLQSIKLMLNGCRGYYEGCKSCCEGFARLVVAKAADSYEGCCESRRALQLCGGCIYVVRLVEGYMMLGGFLMKVEKLRPASFKLMEGPRRWRGPSKRRWVFEEKAGGLHEEGQRLRVEGQRLHVEGQRLLVEGHRLHEEGQRLHGVTISRRRQPAPTQTQI
ncbi:hypothetical protein Tco_0389667 [Tanacetum coccineum]